ncbi:MAG: transcription-repair coupling factor [Spirochaetaceae bacterium]|nr:transcription-repair coupling factor [Spirochaetaceae bacterium]
MNTLPLNLLENALSSWDEVHSLIASLSENQSQFPLEIEGLQGSSVAYFIQEFLKKRNTQLLHKIQYGDTGRYSKKTLTDILSQSDYSENDLLLVVPSEKEANELILDIKTFSQNSDIEILSLPWWGMVPYRAVAKGSVVFGQRMAFLSRLITPEHLGRKKPKGRIFVVSQRSAMIPVPPADFLKKQLLVLKKGDTFDPTALAQTFVSQGYMRVPRVTVKGEFTLRGEVLDIFMPGEENPHRIVFDFDQIEQIKTFNTETQGTLESFDSLLLYPMKEVVWTDELVHQLEERLLEKKDLQPHIEFFRDGLLSELLLQKESEGEELFYPLVWEKKYSIFDYLPADVPVFYIDYDRQENAQESFDREFLGLYRKATVEKPVPTPNDIFFNFNDLLTQHAKKILLRTIHGSLVSENRMVIECDPPRSFFGNINYLKECLGNLQKDDWKIFIFGESEQQALRIEELLKDFVGEKLFVLPFGISSGFGVPRQKILVIQENEIFGRRKHAPRSVNHAKSAVIDTFVELNPGDYVVHVNYGIGLFKGIERVKVMGNERDYIKLQYADEEVVFIPIEQVNLVQRYIGNEGSAPHLDRLGSKSWENRKNKVKKAVEDIAEKLIALYSKRKAARGFPFPKDNEWQTAFDAAFPYTETEDQLTVAEEIRNDMEKPVPMDRLLCGDVGYGKTELAMRAAFKAVMGGKQVAFLAPTTILAEQHYESCLERFENFPVTIAHLSRFVPKAEQKKILEKVARGEVDILVGTHRIIQKDVVFKDLGLMIADEEQRFGVKDKERLKELKTNIDALAMSATPIPRTLHMSLLKIRDMSLLTTPPQNRQAIETVIDSYNDDRVASAIRREVERGGQIFYLHNRVEDLDEVRLKLQRLVPEMMIDIAHGQMSATELDDIFRRFKMGGFHILVATTIIENGINIPNVNTIIIDRADMYGVSQLYQLRGRVGRSDRKAYAYLLYPEGRALSEVAMKRLQVISDFTELGSGFKIAMKDMEIRGAGNLLGKDQSGEVYSVGFDLYLRLLEEAVQRLSDEHYQENLEVLLELEYTGFIPDSYITNPQTKMEIYKKIAAINTKDELERVYSELADRFGPIPDEVYSLLALADIRCICKQLFIASLKERGGQVTIEFARVSDINIDKVLRLINEGGGTVKLDPQKPNVLILLTGKIGLKEKSAFIREKLEVLLS